MEYNLGAHLSLTEKSSEWRFNVDQDPELLERSMIDFMISNKGIGLAANQIGITKRVFVMGSYTIPDFPEPFALFNPKILETSKEIIPDKEGCLSYPGLFLSIKRPSWIIAEYQDSKGNIKEIRVDGYLSKCFQHELDHLEGICFVDKVSSLKLNLAMKKLRKIKR
jgi:peptide deformylase